MESVDRLMKIRWNACHAGSKILANPFFDRRPNWHERLLSALLRALETCENFKVKINAAAALLSVRSREQLGALHAPLLLALLAAAGDADNEDDRAGAETKHKLDLADSVLLAAARMVALGAPADLEAADAALTRDQVDGLRFVMAQALKRVAPERHELFCAARAAVAADRQRLRNLNLLFSEPEM